MSSTESEVEDKKNIKKDLLVVVDEASFEFPTGDKYDGTFEAKKKDRSLKMHGPGKYTTADGDVYSGNWHFDTLTDEVSITYQSGSKYEGPLRDWSYSGKGKYTYPDSTVLSCNFHDNCPTGDLELTDPNGRVWLAKAAQGFAWFAPTNHYYDMLDKRSDATIRRRKMKRDPNALKASKSTDKKSKKKRSPKASPSKTSPTKTPKTSPKNSPKTSPSQKDNSLPKKEKSSPKTTSTQKKKK